MTTHRTRSRKISSVASAALALLVLTGSVGHLDHLARPWSEFLCISLRVGIETLPSISLGAWQISEPYLLGHLRVLESLLKGSASCWQIVLTLARVA
jgi:hypothetical protein